MSQGRWICRSNEGGESECYHWAVFNAALINIPVHMNTEILFSGCNFPVSGHSHRSYTVFLARLPHQLKKVLTCIWLFFLVPPAVHKSSYCWFEQCFWWRKLQILQHTHTCSSRNQWGWFSLAVSFTQTLSELFIVTFLGTGKGLTDDSVPGAFFSGHQGMLWVIAAHQEFLSSVAAKHIIKANMNSFRTD